MLRLVLDVAEGNIDTVVESEAGLLGPVGLEVARAADDLPGPDCMPVGSRFELKRDGFLC